MRLKNDKVLYGSRNILFETDAGRSWPSCACHRGSGNLSGAHGSKGPLEGLELDLPHYASSSGQAATENKEGGRKGETGL